jgi:hypothetical protein
VAKRTTGGGPWITGVVAAVLGDTTPTAQAPVAHSNATSIRRIGCARITSTSGAVPPRAGYGVRRLKNALDGSPSCEAEK